MATCEYQPWSVKDLAAALKSMHADKKEIVVPIFQRGKRWKAGQENAFIDSLIKGFPVGTMLFYRTVSGEREIYTLVDGLQRGNTIRKFMSEPTKYFNMNQIPENVIDSLFSVLGLSGNESKIKEQISEVFTTVIHTLKSFSGIQYYPIARKIEVNFPTLTANATDRIIEIIEPFLASQQELYEKIEKATIPVIIYSGPEETLPEIFDRINSKGTPLSAYEVYAASWPIDKRFKVNNADIVEYVMKKYDSLADDEYVVKGYNRDEMRTSQLLSAFEYAFGFSKYICNKYPILAFDRRLKDDEINTFGFELLNACLYENREAISGLFNALIDNDVNLLESRILECIEFVEKVIKPVTRFKGNSRDEVKRLHTKYQILSMIAAIFREKYNQSDLTQAKETWKENRKIIQKNMYHHYVIDIMSDEWSDGGLGKLFTSSRPNKYIKPISGALWESVLNGYYEQSNTASQIGKVQSPKNEDLVFLNCIYLSTFSAMDQLSIDSFDVEHIATKDIMKKLIARCSGSGLPISSIANLCYLPERVNRSKREKTFYQDSNYLLHIDLNDVEEKYSFTKKDDLEWTEYEYTKDDYNALKDFYFKFLAVRFKKQKAMFYQSMGIEIAEDDSEYSEDVDTGQSDFTVKTLPRVSSNDTKPSAFHDECISKINQHLGVKLRKKKRSVYASMDNKSGVVVSVSKKYMQGSREKYWFAYRSSAIEVLSEYENKYVAFGCGSAENIVFIPISELEKAKFRLNFSESETAPIYWHIVFFKDSNGNWSWLLSRPTVEEINIKDKLI